jgi:hypothetical protein
VPCQDSDVAQTRSGCVTRQYALGTAYYSAWGGSILPRQLLTLCHQDAVQVNGWTPGGTSFTIIKRNAG